MGRSFGRLGWASAALCWIGGLLVVIDQWMSGLLRSSFGNSSFETSAAIRRLNAGEDVATSEPFSDNDTDTEEEDAFSENDTDMHEAIPEDEAETQEEPFSENETEIEEEEEALTENENVTEEAPSENRPDNGSGRSCGINVMTVTAKGNGAQTKEAVYVSFKVSGVWSKKYALFHSTRRAEGQEKMFNVTGRPTHVRVSKPGWDSWVIWRLTLQDSNGYYCMLPTKEKGHFIHFRGRPKVTKSWERKSRTWELDRECWSSTRRKAGFKPAPLCGPDRYKGPYFVDPNRGNDDNNGAQDQPFATVRKCVAMAKKVPGGAPGSMKLLPWPTQCFLRAGRYKERVELKLVRGLTIEGFPGEDAIFDGTEVLSNLEWKVDGGVSRTRIPDEAEADRRPAIIVAGDAIQCTRSVGGAKVLKNKGKCFRWVASDGWPVLFKKRAAEVFYSISSVQLPIAPTPFWYDNDRKILSVHTASYPEGLPEVRVKKRTAGIYFVKGEESWYGHQNAWDWWAEDVVIKNLKFYGARVGTDLTGWKVNSYLQNIHIIGNRFLYHPYEINIETKKRRGRWGGNYIHIADNILEFGEGSLYYTASKALIERNYFAFNALDISCWHQSQAICYGDLKRSGTSKNTCRRPFLIDALGIADKIINNTGIYFGNAGAVRTWSPWYKVIGNLFLGANMGQGSKDNAMVHSISGSQKKLVIKGNWFLGTAATVKSVRFDTGGSTKCFQMGKDGTVTNNVAFGLAPMTIKGNKHNIFNNTGNSLNIVTQFGAVKVGGKCRGMNSETTTKWNLMNTITSRGKVGGKMPGIFKHNVKGSVCSRLRDCNLAALKNGLVRNLSAFDFRPWSSKLQAGAYAADVAKSTPGVPMPVHVFPDFP